MGEQPSPDENEDDGPEVVAHSADMFPRGDDDNVVRCGLN